MDSGEGRRCGSIRHDAHPRPRPFPAAVVTGADYVAADKPGTVHRGVCRRIGFGGAWVRQDSAKATGRPGYAPADLLKLYIYGYLTRIIHRGWAELREAARWSVVFGGVGDAADQGLRLRRGVCTGASGPVVYGGSLAIRPARLAKPAW